MHRYYTGCQDDRRGGNSMANSFSANDLAHTTDTYILVVVKKKENIIQHNNRVRYLLLMEVARKHIAMFLSTRDRNNTIIIHNDMRAAII